MFVVYYILYSIFLQNAHILYIFIIFMVFYVCLAVSFYIPACVNYIINELFLLCDLQLFFLHIDVEINTFSYFLQKNADYCKNMFLLMCRKTHCFFCVFGVAGKNQETQKLPNLSIYNGFQTVHFKQFRDRGGPCGCQSRPARRP